MSALVRPKWNVLAADLFKERLLTMFHLPTLSIQQNKQGPFGLLLFITCSENRCLTQGNTCH